MCSLKGAKEVAIFLSVIVSLINWLLCNNGGNKSIKFGDVLVDSISCQLFEVKELTFKAEFVFARLGGVALLKGKPDFGGSRAGFDAGFVFVGNRLIEKGFGFDHSIGIKRQGCVSGRSR